MITRREVEDFLYREARLMDSHAYDEWFALWTNDARYWIPCNDDDHDTGTHVSLVHEDHEGLVDRITRLKSGAAWAQDPKSRLCRVVSNIEFSDTYDSECEVHSTFNLTAVRRGRAEIIAGRNRHQLRVTDDGLRIVAKTVILVDNDEVMNNLSFLI
jgi:3-phenylpropionate/cinnamic acid dioxygenase small subunit